jgi:hypothetical protein
MGLARPTVAKRNHVLPPRDIAAARQLQNQHLVQGRNRPELKAVQAFHGREPRLTNATLDQPPLAIEQLKLAQPQQITRVVDPLGRTLPGQLVVLAKEGRQLQRLEMMRQENLRDLAHA